MQTLQESQWKKKHFKFSLSLSKNRYDFELFEETAKQTSLDFRRKEMDSTFFENFTSNETVLTGIFQTQLNMNFT